jgi:hypothetical protein
MIIGRDVGCGILVLWKREGKKKEYESKQASRQLR